MPQSKMSPNRIQALERARQALSLRREGKRYDEIGEALGITASGAWRLVQRAYRRAQKQNDSEVEFQRKLDLERCDVAISALWPNVLAGKYGAIERLMQVLERRAKLLGLDAPVKVDIEHRIRAIAAEAGLDPEEAVREAQRIVSAGIG